MYIYFWIRSIRIAGAFCPTFVHNNILDTVFGCKIDVIFIGLEIESGYEIHIRAIRRGFVPPFPTNLSRLDPRYVLQLTLGSQSVCHCVFYKLLIIFCNDEVAPRKISFACCFGYIIRFLYYLQATVAIFSKFERGFWKCRLYSVYSIPFKEHARVIR